MTDTDDSIPFNRPVLTGHEFAYIQQAFDSHRLAGGGSFTKTCEQWLKSAIHCQKALLTPSCTAALEMAAMLIDIQPGQEVIMPSFTFVSTANAFVLRGGVPVFVDIRPDTLNLDEQQLEAAITDKTVAIVPVHYAGVGCDMSEIMAIAHQHGLWVVEDNAQGILSTHRSKPLGSWGHLAAISFHETKNIGCGEGGALLVNDPDLVSRAEIIREKGTDRSRFLRGEIDKYTWQEVGSSYLTNEPTAAFLWAQLQQAQQLITQRLAIWHTYDRLLAPLAQRYPFYVPSIPSEATHNAHIYWVMTENLEIRTALLAHLKAHHVQATFHYVPLHTAPAGMRFGRVASLLPHTDHLSQGLIRLPIWAGMTEQQVERICQLIKTFYEEQAPTSIRWVVTANPIVTPPPVLHDITLSCA